MSLSASHSLPQQLASLAGICSVEANAVPMYMLSIVCPCLTVTLQILIVFWHSESPSKFLIAWVCCLAMKPLDLLKDRCEVGLN
jgi:hypothetical protein